MDTPVFLLPAGIAGSAVDEFIELLWIVYAIIQRKIVLKAAVVFPCRLAAGNAFRTQVLNIFYRKEGSSIVDVCGDVYKRQA